VIHEQAPFTYLDDRAKRVVELARRRADGHGSHVIGPEHVLLALVAVRHGLAARVVANLAGSSASAESVIADVRPPGRQPSPVHIPFDAAGEEAMVRAAQQARSMGDDRIGTEHLLLGILATDNAAVRGLSTLGVTYDAARAEIQRLRADG
jgi:ATP-dependent Clp protease ATP-binding subunit ClpA